MSDRARLALLPVLLLALSPISFACSGGRKGVEAGAAHPYGVNNWRWPLSTCGVFRDAHLDRYRVMVNWKHFEPSPDAYDWRGEPYLEEALAGASALGAKISLCIFDSPEWARSEARKVLSYPPEEYASFVTECLGWCERNYPGVVEAVEVENEHPTGVWSDAIPVTNGTDQRDPSWYYGGILERAHAAIRAFNAAHGTSILVVLDGIWQGAHHHIDELYQLGLGESFDRINFHYYLVEQMSQDQGRPEDPADRGTVWHFDTNLAYLAHIAAGWGDGAKPIWLTEFGWRLNPEKDPEAEVKKAGYLRYVLDASRISGLVERTNVYVGTSRTDRMALAYVDSEASPTIHDLTDSYHMYRDYGAAYAGWAAGTRGRLGALPAAERDVAIANSGFEDGSAAGWDGLEADGAIRYAGAFSGTRAAPGSARTRYCAAEPGRLYEVWAWIRVEAEGPDACLVRPSISIRTGEGLEDEWQPPNTWGLVDTRNYPGGWRRIRFMFLMPAGGGEIALALGASGAGRLWVDEAGIRALRLGS